MTVRAAIAHIQQEYFPEDVCYLASDDGEAPTQFRASDAASVMDAAYLGELDRWSVEVLDCVVLGCASVVVTLVGNLGHTPPTPYGKCSACGAITGPGEYLCAGAWAARCLRAVAGTPDDPFLLAVDVLAFHLNCGYLGALQAIDDYQAGADFGGCAVTLRLAADAYALEVTV